MLDLEYLKSPLHPAFEREELKFVEDILLIDASQDTAIGNKSRTQSRTRIPWHLWEIKTNQWPKFKKFRTAQGHRITQSDSAADSIHNLDIVDSNDCKGTVAASDKVDAGPVSPSPSKVASHSAVADGVPVIVTQSSFGLAEAGICCALRCRQISRCILHVTTSLDVH